MRRHDSAVYIGIAEPDVDHEARDGREEIASLSRGLDRNDEDVPPGGRNRKVRGARLDPSDRVIDVHPHATGEGEGLAPPGGLDAFVGGEGPAGHADTPATERFVQREGNRVTPLRISLDERDSRAETAPLIERDHVGREGIRGHLEVAVVRGADERDAEPRAVPANHYARPRETADARDGLVPAVHVDAVSRSRDPVAIEGDRNGWVVRGGDERVGQRRVA